MPPKKTASTNAAELRIEYLRLDALLRWPGNPKEHADAAIQASIERFGFRDPVAIDEATGRLVAGHGRLAALERAHKTGSPLPKYLRVDTDGMWLIPVTRGGQFESEDEAKAYLVAHNRVGELGGWDSNLLADFLQPLDTDLLAFTGFDLDGFLQSTPDVSFPAMPTNTPTATTYSPTTSQTATPTQSPVVAPPPPPEPPSAFPEFDESIQTEHRCPKCGYEWSGKSR